MQNLTLQISQSNILVTSSSICTVLMYNGQRASPNYEVCLTLVHPVVLKIRIKSRPPVDMIGSHAHTKRTGNTHFGPVGKAIPKILSNPRRFCQVPHIGIALYVALQPLWGQGLLMFDASRLYSDTPRSVGFLRTSHQSVAETST